MNTHLGRVFNLAAQQRGVVAVWQMKEIGLTQSQVNVAVRGWRRVHRGVYAVGDLDELGWFRAATLIAPGAVLSHETGLALLGLIDAPPAAVHVTLPKRSGPATRDGLVIHRTRKPVEWGDCYGIPVTSPTQSLKDAKPPRTSSSTPSTERRTSATPCAFPSMPSSDSSGRPTEGRAPRRRPCSSFCAPSDRPWRGQSRGGGPPRPSGPARTRCCTPPIC